MSAEHLSMVQELLAKAYKCGLTTLPVLLLSLKAPFTRYILLSNRLSNRFDNRFYRVNGV